jgi:hypothetical protein|tara:strand:- start:774 stop:959 length:186 start_codon:yes stop_codon:yes gene_type:complete
MIRWYDWALAFLAADFIIANISLALTAQIWYLNLIGGAAVYFLYDLWLDYCKFRKIREYGK